MIDSTEALELLDIVIRSLFYSKADNLKTVHVLKAAIWEHGQIIKQTKRILNADTKEPHLKNTLEYSDRKDKSYSNLRCLSYSLNEIWNRKIFRVFVGKCQVYSLV